MSKLIDVQWQCPACKTVSQQTFRKPSLLTPTMGWIKCHECLCQFHISATLNTKHRMADGRPKLDVAVMDYKRSKRYEERLAFQRERDAKCAKELKQQVDDVGHVVVPPARQYNPLDEPPPDTMGEPKVPT